MGSNENRLRKKWQDYSGQNAGEAERSFFQTFEILFNGTEYEIQSKPKDFDKIYVDVALTAQEEQEIYMPATPVTKHGVSPDYAIVNNTTKKTIYVEVKRQDGWVEGKDRAAGRGNAHERSNKFFTPGLQKILRQKGNLGEDVLPFWTIFQGDITRDPCRVREIKLWYDNQHAHYFLWRDSKNPEPLIEHFITYIQPLLS